MFVRTKLNSSGSTSVQIISKARGRYKVVKSFGSATTRQEIDRLVHQKAQQEIDHLSKPQDLFPSETDEMIRSVLSTLSNSNIQTVGPEIIFGKIYDHIGFNKIGEESFRHLVISRIAFPLSKLKTIDYLSRYQGVMLSYTLPASKQSQTHLLKMDVETAGIICYYPKELLGCCNAENRSL